MNENRHIIYMGELYILTLQLYTLTVQKYCTDNSLNGLLAPMSKGYLVIMIHAGSENSFP
jgi:hypothetical protein